MDSRKLGGTVVSNLFSYLEVGDLKNLKVRTGKVLSAGVDSRKLCGDIRC
ncbi:MAG: hypothetical protein LBB88_08930 [Planctomycetaceae bacterium]|nr:hypothetical protein [Planctomycetaceae bacterium]